MEAYLFNRYGIKYKQVWFFDESLETDHRSFDADIIEFKESNNELKGLYPFYNGILDLKKGLNALHDRFDKGFKYEIRRAEKENYESFVHSLDKEEELKKIFNCYIEFSKQKNIPFIDYRFLKSFLQHNALLISAVRINGSILQYHIYYKSSAELILLASFPSPDITIKKSALGFANRALHWFDIQFADQLKLQTYNLGGIGNNNSDPQILSIANFKMEMSPERKIYYQGLMPVTLKGKLFLGIKSSIKKHVKAGTVFTD
jgi:hypothetical protein